MKNFVSKIEIEINSNCNRKCSWCPNYEFTRSENGKMDVNTLKNLFLQLREMKYDESSDKWIHPHFYGEPLLEYELLLETIDLAKKILPKVGIKVFTNGDLLDIDKIKILFNKGVNYFIVTNHNISNYHPFEKLYKILPSELKDIIIYRHHSIMSKSNRSGILENLGNVFSNISCPAPSDILVVTLSGNVVPCSDDFFGKNIMGNINNQSLVDIWNSSKYVEFREDLLSGKRHKYEACKNCNTIWHSNNPFSQVEK